MGGWDGDPSRAVDIQPLGRYCNEEIDRFSS